MSVVTPRYDAEKYIEETIKTGSGQRGDYAPLSFFIPNAYKGRLDSEMIYDDRG